MTENNWSLAVPVAKRVAGNYPLADTYHLAHMQSQVPDLFNQAAEMVATETGLSTPGAPSVLVVSRAEWAERNLKTFSRMLAPLEEKIAQRLEEAGQRLPTCAGQAGDLARNRRALGHAGQAGFGAIRADPSRG